MSRPQRIRDLIEALERARVTEHGLDAVEAARDLRLAAERLERTQVKAARGHGVSWAKIGAAYGLSKQGAQQRFARRHQDAAGADEAASDHDGPAGDASPTGTAGAADATEIAATHRARDDHSARD